MLLITEWLRIYGSWVSVTKKPNLLPFVIICLTTSQVSLTFLRHRCHQFCCWIICIETNVLKIGYRIIWSLRHRLSTQFAEYINLPQRQCRSCISTRYRSDLNPTSVMVRSCSGSGGGWRPLWQLQASEGRHSPLPAGPHSRRDARACNQINTVFNIHFFPERDRELRGRERGGNLPRKLLFHCIFWNPDGKTRNQT